MNRPSHVVSPQFEHGFFSVMVEDERVRAELTGTDERVFGRGRDMVYYYDLFGTWGRVGEAVLTHRELTEAGGYFFIEVVRDGARDGVVSISWDGDAEWHDFTGLEYDISHDSTVGVDPVKGPYGLVSLASGGELLVGRGVLSHDLRKDYGDGNYSRVRVLDEHVEDVVVSRDGVRVDFSYPDESERFEMWLMYGENGLLSRERLDAVKADMTENYRRYHKWVTPHGVYAKLPWSIEPFHEMGFGRNIGYQFRNRADHVEAYAEYGQLYDELVVLNTLVMLESLWDEFSEYKLLPTEFTSTWLKEPYGIHALYYDTRHNEALGNYLLRVEEVFGFDYTDEFLTYADYLVEALDGDNVIDVGGAVLLADYDGPGITETPHASLNHVLGEIYYLLQAYFVSGDEVYLDAAYELRLGVEALGGAWIRTDEKAPDLWYQVNADLTFGGNDYSCLTLVDLEKNQEMWAKTEYGKSDVFQRLLEAKVEARVCERSE
ncbi:hypothetical protein ACLIA0_05730 [Bacillaceae bacterium W0354]